MSTGRILAITFFAAFAGGYIGSTLAPLIFAARDAANIEAQP